MNEKIEKINNELVIKVPMKTERCNPWDESYHPEMDNIVGLIESDLDMGLCYRIDMDYKGKDDQLTDYFFKWFGERKDFLKLCDQLSLDVVEVC